MKPLQFITQQCPVWQFLHTNTGHYSYNKKKSSSKLAPLPMLWLLAGQHQGQQDSCHQQ